MGTAAENVNCGIVHHDMIIKKCDEIVKLAEKFISLEQIKDQLEMDKTKGAENRCLRVDEASASFDSAVELDKMEASQSMYVHWNKSRRYSSRSSRIKKSPIQPSRGYNLRSKRALEKSDQIQTFTPRLNVEDVRRHITYRLNQEESEVVERWRCHPFGTTEGDNVRFGATSMQDSGLLAMDIQCLVYKGHRNLHRLWLNNNVVHCYGEILMKWARCYPDREYIDFSLSPYAGVIALARLNDRDDLCWVKKLMKGLHNRGKWLRWVCAIVLGYDDSHSWDFIYPKDIPQQVNGHDCGVFVLTYMASIIMSGSIVPFSTEEVCGIRDCVLVELSKGQLVGF